MMIRKNNEKINERINNDIDHNNGVITEIRSCL